MSLSLSSVLVVLSVVVLECTYGVLAQQLADVDFPKSSWTTERRPQFNEEFLRNLGEYLEYARNLPGPLRHDVNAIQVAPQDGLAPLKTHKRACFNVLDACCMFNIKCDRFSKKSLTAPDVEKKDSEVAEPPSDVMVPLKPAKRPCFNVLDACCMFNIKCNRMGKKRFS